LVNRAFELLLALAAIAVPLALTGVLVEWLSRRRRVAGHRPPAPRAADRCRYPSSPEGKT